MTAPEAISSPRLACLRIAFGIALFFVIDAAAFRSGVYLRWIAPGSGLGALMRVVAGIRHIPPGQPSILVLGDSRIAEGLSVKLANAEAERLGSSLTFTTGGIPGTVPRVWYYVLRQIDHPAQRIAAVAMMATSYHDDIPEPQADRGSDIVFVHPLLRLTDVADFPASFLSAANRRQAIEAILFSGLFYKNDVQEFLADPLARIHDADAWRKHGAEWIGNYPGHLSSMAGLTMDMATGAVSIAPGHEPTQPNNLASYAEALRRTGGRPADNETATAYRRLWYGRIAEWCRQAGLPLIVFRVPRGPLHSRVGADDRPTGVLADLAAVGRLQLLPADTFDGLERPEFFFDDVHPNHDGRELFSAELARSVLSRLQRDR